MNFSRRLFLQQAAGAAALPAASSFSWAADAWAGSAPLRIVTGFAPGSAADMMARLLAPALSERLDQPVVIEHRMGVGGNRATAAVANAAPDGRTLLLASSSNAISASLYDRLGFDFRRDFASVAGAVEAPNVMLVSPSIGVSTIEAFIAFARAHARPIRMASAGIGTTSHLAGEQFRILTGVEIEHVPYRGGAGINADLLAAKVEVYFPPLIAAIDAIKAGAQRALAVTSARRHPLLDVPAVSEFLPGYATSTWLGIAAPGRTPAALVAQLNRHVNAILNDSAVGARITAAGGTVLTGAPAAFDQLIADDTAHWAHVLASAAKAAS